MEVMMADDALGLAIAGHLHRDVVLEIDVVGPLDDRRPQQEQPLLLRLLPAATIDGPPAGDDHGAGPIREQPLYLHGPLDVIEPELDKLDTVVGKVLVLGNHVPVPATSDTHADHSALIGGGFPPAAAVLKSCETGDRAPAATA